MIESNQTFTPVEIKWTDKPSEKDCRHLQVFMDEYPIVDSGYVVCRTPRSYHITDKVIALPWQSLLTISVLRDDL